MLRLIFAILVLCIFHTTLPGAHAQDISDYRLSSGDTIEFDYLDDEQAPKESTVSSSGYVQIPLLGSIKVLGLSINEAELLIRKSLIDRKLYVEPTFTVAIKSVRPIFVLGDVNKPGSYPFQPYLSVEQAVGIAGGITSATSSVDDRIITRIRLQGDLVGLKSDIARESAWLGRISADMAGREEIVDADLPKESATVIDKNQLSEYLAIENRLLQTARTSFRSQLKILNAGIEQANEQIGVLQKLLSSQEKSIQFARDDVARIEKLSKNGLTTASEVSSAKRQLLQDESRQLEILSDISRTNQQLTNFNQQVVTLTESQVKTSLVELRERKSQITTLLARHAATSEQLYLATNWSAVEADAQKFSAIKYNIRRNGTATLVQSIQASTTILQPGDTLVVAIERPDSATEALTGSTK